MLSDESFTFSPEEAAHFLGITIELLFAYVRNAPKKYLGDQITLSFQEDAGIYRFSKRKLEAFDSYLKTPWPPIGDKRPAVPRYIEDYLKIESRGMCARCSEGVKLVTAHIIPYSESQCHHHHNLIRLCSKCHDGYDTNLISKADLQSRKTSLVQSLREALRNRGPTTRRLPGHMPTPNPSFVGRVEELAELQKFLTTGQRICIEGTGGIGKTELLIQALSASSEERTILWLDVDSYKTVAEVEIALSRALSLTGRVTPIESIVQALENEHLIVVFDGVESLIVSDADNAETFFRILATHLAKPLLVFTSQMSIIGISHLQTLKVGPIPNSAGLALLKSATETEISPDPLLLDSLNTFCGGHPLTLNITLGLLQYFKSIRIVHDRILNNPPSSLLHPQRSMQTKQTSLSACLEVVSSTISEEQLSLLWTIAQSPVGVLRGSLELMAKDICSDSQIALAEIMRRNLVLVVYDTWFGQRIHMLSPLRSFFSNRLTSESPALEAKLALNLVTHTGIQATVIDATRIRKGDVADGIARFDQEYSNIISALGLCSRLAPNFPEFVRFISVFANSLMIYFFVRGDCEQGAQIMKAGAKAARILGHPINAGDLLLQMLTLGVRAKKVEIVLEASSLLQNLMQESSEPTIAAKFHLAMVDVELIKAKPARAHDHALQAVQLYEAAALKFRSTQSTHSDDDDDDESIEEQLSLSYFHLGSTLEKLGKSAEALVFYAKSLAISKHTQDKINIGAVLHQMGNCESECKNYKAAFKHYSEAARFFNDVEMQISLSNALGELGYLLIEWRPSELASQLPPKETLENGLMDVTNELVETFDADLRQLQVDKSLQVMRKAFGIIALFSFTNDYSVLQAWAQSVRREVLMPILSQVDQNQRPVDDQLLIMHLDLIVTLALNVSNVPIDLPKADDREIAHLANICYSFGQPGWVTFRPFEWLSVYLQFCRKGSNVGTDTLRSMASSQQ